MDNFRTIILLSLLLSTLTILTSCQSSEIDLSNSYEETMVLKNQNSYYTIKLDEVKYFGCTRSTLYIGYPMYMNDSKNINLENCAQIQNELMSFFEEEYYVVKDLSGDEFYYVINMAIISEVTFTDTDFEIEVYYGVGEINTKINLSEDDFTELQDYLDSNYIE